MGDGNEITLLTIFDEIKGLRGDVFSAIESDRKDCRTRHDAINIAMTSAQVQNGNQDKQAADLEKRFRTTQTIVIAASGGVAVIMFLLKFM